MYSLTCVWEKYWLIECLGFYATSAMFQPYNGGWERERERQRQRERERPWWDPVSSCRLLTIIGPSCRKQHSSCMHSASVKHAVASYSIKICRYTVLWQRYLKRNTLDIKWLYIYPYVYIEILAGIKFSVLAWKSNIYLMRRLILTNYH